MVSVPAYETGRGFLTLSANPSVARALGSNSIEKFNGAGSWDKHHVATSFVVASGDIVLIRRAGIQPCPGLSEQIQLLASTETISEVAIPSSSTPTHDSSSNPPSPVASSSSGPGLPSGTLSKEPIVFTKRRREASVDRARKRRKSDEISTFGELDFINLCSDSD
jgi:hypothetical protein